MRGSNDSRFQSILVPLDGSEFAERALPTALSVARRHGAALHVVRVYIPVAGVAGEHAVPYDEVLDRELMKQARDYLDGVVARLEAVAGVRASAALLDGPVAPVISKHATAVDADLFVMTTQGRGPLARFWLGSVSDELVRQAGVPILFVRPQTAASDFAREPTLCRVLIPLDGSALAEQILEPALRFARAADVAYTLLQVIRSTAELSYGPAGGTITGFQESLKKLRELERQESERAQSYLDRLAERLRGRSFDVKTRVVWNERPATAILDDASAHCVDLIALATRGRGGLKRFVLGSVADKVLRGADSAVLVYRPSDESA